ncbi:MAG: hypothetical protein ACPGJV_10455 [Bacteriovoracaceae bacterium]
MIKRLGFLFIFLTCFQAEASLELGYGMNSTHGGRTIPSLAIAAGTKRFIVSAFSSGVKTNYYYHSTHGLHLLALAKAGDILEGPVVFGLGLGIIHQERGFKDVDATQTDSKSDIVIGPAVRVNWTFFKVMYLNVDATYGLRDVWSHLTLNFQDVISASVGVRIW